MPKTTSLALNCIFLVIRGLGTLSQDLLPSSLAITKCCPEPEVFDLYSRTCKSLDTDYLDDLNNFQIEPNAGFNATVAISSIALPVCNENIYQERFYPILPDNDVYSDTGFFTHFDEAENQLIMYDFITGKPSADFCLDRAYDLGPYATSVSFIY